MTAGRQLCSSSEGIVRRSCHPVVNLDLEKNSGCPDKCTQAHFRSSCQPGKAARRKRDRRKRRPKPHSRRRHPLPTSKSHRRSCEISAMVPAILIHRWDLGFPGPEIHRPARQVFKPQGQAGFDIRGGGVRTPPASWEWWVGSGPPPPKR